MDRMEPITVGVKRELNEITDSEVMSPTSTSSFNTAPITPFGSLLPPLNKKPKLMESTTDTQPPHFVNTNSIYAPPLTHIQAESPQIVSMNPIATVLNHSTAYTRSNNCYLAPAPLPTTSPPIGTSLSLDTIISTLSGLNSLNCTQLHALKTLILSANDTTANNSNPHPIIAATKTPITQSIAAPHARSAIPPPSMVHHHSIPIVARRFVPNPPPPPPPPPPPRHISFRPVAAPINPKEKRITTAIHCNNALSNVSLCTDDIKRASCHQCKTKKDINVLFYCTKTRPCCNDSFKRKKCRKKFCESCMGKYYLDRDVLRLRSVKNMNGWCWQCPACVGICSCRACKRKKANQEKEKKNENSNSHIIGSPVPIGTVSNQHNRNHNIPHNGHLYRTH